MPKQHMLDSICPYCHTAHDAAASTEATGAPPSDGDITICWACHNWAVYTDVGNGVLVLKKPEDYGMDGDQIQKITDRVAAAIRSMDAVGEPRTAAYFFEKAEEGANDGRAMKMFDRAGHNFAVVYWGPEAPWPPRGKVLLVEYGDKRTFCLEEHLTMLLNEWDVWAGDSKLKFREFSTGDNVPMIVHGGELIEAHEV